MHSTAQPDDTQQRLVTALRDAGCYPHAARRVSLVETHISWVLLAGSYAYKIKKALDLGFLDFSTLAARRHCCDEELRLNRRLAPQIYLDVVPIGGHPDAPVLGAEPALEYAVRMRRFAAARQFDRLLARGQLLPQHIDLLARRIAQFHAALPPAAADSPYGSPSSICAAAQQNFVQMRPLLRDAVDLATLDDLQQATTSACAALAPLMTARRQQGRVRECHGDLHLGNIVMLRGQAAPFDGIEFNADLRWIDVISEIAFTVMDLRQYRRADLASRFLNGWLEESGDYAGLALLRFYVAYRAAVRAKVGAIRLAQDGLSARALQQALAECRRYLALAQQAWQPGRPALIITHGLPGSGKTTFSQQALERLGAIRIRSDVERKRLHGLSPLAASSSQPGAGLYGADATRLTYARLLELAHDLLRAGYCVIVDAAFLKREERAQFRQLAGQMQAPFAIASVRAGEATLRARISQRQCAGTDA
ncbi:MAG TPA: AAA family ATPase, partial [Gallionellaceae bacterium]|nr:AAA family ATPase [Gallionellaceae bacterium]